MSNITNKEALKDKIHEIHNYLRNNGAGYGLGALRIFNIFYGLKKLEEANLLQQLNLKMPECSFNYLLKLANKGEDEILADTIYKAVLDSINESTVNRILFYEIPKHIKSVFFTFLIKEINKISEIEKTCNVLLSGKVYEYFIGRESSISELGAYFTDRHIVNYIYDKLDLKLNENNTVKSMVDCFGGSGGFTTGYIDFLNKKYGSIQWNTEINKIFQYDVNEDVLKTAALEIFCMTGQMPDMMKNIKYRNSFTMEIEDKYDLVITNPPYGGDKIIYSDTQIKRDKIKNYIKKELETLTDEEKIKNRNIQLKNIENAEKKEEMETSNMSVCLKTCSNRICKYAHLNNIKNANDKEACSLILMMDLLNENGTCAGVLKEGLFFNKSYTQLRKTLIHNFNVREIISIPADQFENTTTKTSIVIFDNTVQKTTEIKFSELIIERIKEDKFIEFNDIIVLSENKDDIFKLNTKLISTATLDDLNNNIMCSLHGLHYSKKYIVCGEEYELKKLGDLCDINKSSKLTKNKYNYVEISDITENIVTKSKEYLKENLPSNAKIIASNNNILISCVRPKKSKMTLITDEFKNLENYVFSTAIANISLHEKENSYYVYAILYAMSDNFEKDLCKGSSYPRLSPLQFKNLMIPMPKTLEKLNELNLKFKNAYEELYFKKSKIFEQYVSDLLKEAIVKITNPIEEYNKIMEDTKTEIIEPTKKITKPKKIKNVEIIKETKTEIIEQTKKIIKPKK